MFFIARRRRSHTWAQQHTAAAAAVQARRLAGGRQARVFSAPLLASYRLCQPPSVPLSPPLPPNQNTAPGNRHTAPPAVSRTFHHRQQRRQAPWRMGRPPRAHGSSGDARAGAVRHGDRETERERRQVGEPSLKQQQPTATAHALHPTRSKQEPRTTTGAPELRVRIMRAGAAAVVVPAGVPDDLQGPRLSVHTPIHNLDLARRCAHPITLAPVRRAALAPATPSNRQKQQHQPPASGGARALQRQQCAVATRARAPSRGARQTATMTTTHARAHGATILSYSSSSASLACSKPHH
jgi:hypothetical protein